jgi:hydroxymethylpyrimidine kinase/phosphomethylpyrimidine kinase
MKTVLTIAGSDPSGGAGIQADLRTFSAFHLKGLSVITALTAQEQKCVRGVLPVPATFIRKQLETLVNTCEINAVKVGMLAKKDTIIEIIRIFKELDLKNIVLDPILVSSSGFPLLEKKGIPKLKELFSQTLIVTPNIHETSVLTGIKIIAEGDMEKAAIKIKDMGSEYVLVKGGHLKGKAVDILYDGKDIRRYVSERIEKEFHGSGCVFSAALAACLAKGIRVEKAVGKAKKFVTNLIKENR